MAIISCPGCQRRLKAPENLAGKTVACPHCKASVKIPGGMRPAKPLPVAERLPSGDPTATAKPPPPRIATNGIPRAPEDEGLPGIAVETRPPGVASSGPRGGAGQRSTGRQTALLWMSAGGGVLLIAILAVGLIVFFNMRPSEVDRSTVAAKDDGHAVEDASPAAGAPDDSEVPSPVPDDDAPNPSESTSAEPTGAPATENGNDAAEEDGEPESADGATPPADPEPAAPPPPPVQDISNFRPLPVDDIGTYRACVLPGSRYLFVLSRQTNALCFDAYSGQRWEISSSDSELKLLGVTLTPNRRQAIVRATRRFTPGIVRALWDLENKTLVRRVSLQCPPVYLILALTDDARLALTAAAGPFVNLYDTETGQRVRNYGFHEKATTSRVSMTADGRRILLAGDSRAEFIDREQRDQSGHFVGGHRCQAATLSRDGRLAAMTGTRVLGAQVTIFTVADREMLHAIMALRKPINALKFSDDGRFLFCGGEDATVTAWDTSTGHQLCRFMKTDPAAIHGINVSPDGRLVVASCRQGDSAVWQTPETLWCETAADAAESGVVWNEVIAELLAQTLTARN